MEERKAQGARTLETRMQTTSEYDRTTTSEPKKYVCNLVPGNQIASVQPLKYSKGISTGISLNL